MSYSPLYSLREIGRGVMMSQNGGSRKKTNIISDQRLGRMEEEGLSSMEGVMRGTTKFLEAGSVNHQERPQEDQSEKMTPLTEYQFFTVWTEAAGRPGYDKSLFREVFESLKSRNLVIPSRLSPVDFSSRCEVREFEKLPAVSGLACFSRALLGRD